MNFDPACRIKPAVLCTKWTGWGWCWMKVTSSETLVLFRAKLCWGSSQSAGGSCLVRSFGLPHHLWISSKGQIINLNAYEVHVNHAYFCLQELPFRTPWRICTCCCPFWSWSLLMWRSGGTESFRDLWQWATDLDWSMLIAVSKITLSVHWI